MKRTALILIIASLLLVGCGSLSECADPLKCVTIEPDEPITIAALLTLTGKDSIYGIDALRGVEIAISDFGNLLGHPIQLVQEDDMCSAEGGKAAAERVLQNQKIAGVIGAGCSDASTTASRTFSEVGLAMISPSSSAPSLTTDENHQPGFLRTVWNDRRQAKTLAEFVYTGLGARTMATIHYGDAYSGELQSETCAIFRGLGGQCVAGYIIEEGTSPQGALTHIALFKPDVLFYPVHIADGVVITELAATSGYENTALIGTDRMLNSTFITQAGGDSEGMYISGPTLITAGSPFYEKYQARYGEAPASVYSTRAYDAAMMLLDAILRTAKTSGRKITIVRADVLAALYATSNFEGISGPLTCSPLGDCAMTEIHIYQVRDQALIPVYP